jgi:hypothetical protein
LVSPVIVADVAVDSCRVTCFHAPEPIRCSIT